MKRRLHLNDFFIQGIATSLRLAGKTADAEVFENIDGRQWTFGYVSGSTYGSSGNACKAYGTNIQSYNIALTRAAMYKNGVKTNFGVSCLNTIAMVPKEIRPPYLKDVTTAQLNGVLTPALLGLDLSKPGCHYISVNNNSDARFVVVVGSNETVTDPATVIKYLPFDMPLNVFNGGFQKTDPAVTGSDAYASSSISNNRVLPVDILVYQGTAPAPAQKEINPNLPNWTMRTFAPTAPKGYEVVPALNLTFNWDVLTAKYASRVHANQLFIDVLADALTTAGNTALAAKVAAMNPETFKAWRVTPDTANKKTNFLGARDDTTKLYFDSITFNNVKGNLVNNAVYFDYVYKPEAGISWTVAGTSTAAMKSSTLNTLLSESGNSYFGIHVPAGFNATEDNINALLPFSVKGMETVVPNRVITADTQVSFNLAQYNTTWFGTSRYSFYIYPDR